MQHLSGGDEQQTEMRDAGHAALQSQFAFVDLLSAVSRPRSRGSEHLHRLGESLAKIPHIKWQTRVNAQLQLFAVLSLLATLVVLMAICISHL